MARIDLMFYEDGTGNVAFGSSLEEDQAEELSSGSDATIVSHLSFEEDDDNYRGTVVNALWALHAIECHNGGGSGGTVFERFVTEIFRAGMQAGRRQDAQVDK